MMGGGMMGGGPEEESGQEQGRDRARAERGGRASASESSKRKLAGGDQPEEAKAKDEKGKWPRPRNRPTRRSPRAIAGSPSPARSTMPRCWPIIARRSRTPRWPTPITDVSIFNARRSSPTARGRSGQIVSSDENFKVLDNLPEEDEELTPETVRPYGLVDPLPFLKAGLWEKVHIASLVPKEKKKIVKSVPPGGLQ